MALNRFHVVSPLALIAVSACKQSYSISIGGAVVNGPLGSRSAELKPYGPDKKEIVSKELVKSGMIHQTASDIRRILYFSYRRKH